MITITCGICGHYGDAEAFAPELPKQPGDPDWICPQCGCGVYTPATLTSDELMTMTETGEDYV